VFERSIRTVANLPCDILLSPHPGFFGMARKLDRLRNGDSDAFAEPGVCGRYAAAAEMSLRARVAQEERAAAP
jgi:metallo-beta-lactamase class B